MKKNLAALLAIPAFAFAQTYPSPTYNVLTLQTPLAVTSGGTGANTASGARTSLGLGTAATQNTGTSGATVPLLNGANTWSALQAFSLRPTFNGATPWDSANLNFATPPAIGGTTPAAGAFTTLSATSTVSGTGFSTYLASPPAIGGTASAAGSFTTLSASGNDALLYSNTSGQSIPNNTPTTLTTFTKVSDRVNANFNASTGTFTAPVTGIYQVGGAVTFSTATGVSGAIYTAAVVANGVTIAQGRIDQTATTSVPVQVTIPLTVVSLTAGQTIIFQVSQSTGVARTMSTAAALNFISINRLP